MYVCRIAECLLMMLSQGDDDGVSFVIALPCLNLNKNDQKPRK